MRSGERRQLLETIAFSVLVPVGFRLFGVAQTQKWLRQWAAAGRGEAPDASIEIIRSLQRAQRIVKHSVGINGTCLTRSLTLWALLRRRGVLTELRVGIRRHEGKLEGHAWVEFDGQPVNESQDVTGTYCTYTEAAAFDGRLTRDRWF